jgi:ParB-like nuclease family protein
MTPEKTMVITSIGGLPTDDLFSNDFGTWNVSLAWRDCQVGLHRVFRLDVEEAYKANKTVQVDKAKVKRFMRMSLILARPLIGVMEDGALYLIDGHHRLRALHRLHVKEFVAFVIEDGTPYQVLYNGERKPPYRAF